MRLLYCTVLEHFLGKNCYFALTSAFRMHPHYHTRTMKTAEKIIENLTVNVLDTARLIQEAAEELGERAKGLERDELIRLLRRVLRSGISALKQEEHTVSFEEAAWASVAERTGRRAATLRDLHHFVRRMLRVEGVAQCSAAQHEYATMPTPAGHGFRRKCPQLYQGTSHSAQYLCLRSTAGMVQ